MKYLNYNMLLKIDNIMQPKGSKYVFVSSWSL